MRFSRPTYNVDNHQRQPIEPTIPAEEVQVLFDKVGSDTKNFLDDHLDELEDTFTTYKQATFKVNVDVLQGGFISGIEIISPGFGYIADLYEFENGLSLTVFGECTSAATVYATINENGEVINIEIISAGEGYTDKTWCCVSVDNPDNKANLIHNHNTLYAPIGNQSKLIATYGSTIVNAWNSGTLSYNSATNTFTCSTGAPPNGTAIEFDAGTGVLPATMKSYNSDTFGGYVAFVINSSGNNFKLSNTYGGLPIGAFGNDGTAGFRFRVAWYDSIALNNIIDLDTQKNVTIDIEADAIHYTGDASNSGPTIVFDNGINHKFIGSTGNVGYTGELPSNTYFTLNNLSSNAYKYVKFKMMINIIRISATELKVYGYGTVASSNTEGKGAPFGATELFHFKAIKPTINLRNISLGIGVGKIRYRNAPVVRVYQNGGAW